MNIERAMIQYFQIELNQVRFYLNQQSANSYNTLVIQIVMIPRPRMQFGFMIGGAVFVLFFEVQQKLRQLKLKQNLVPNNVLNSYDPLIKDLYRHLFKVDPWRQSLQQRQSEEDRPESQNQTQQSSSSEESQIQLNQFLIFEQHYSGHLQCMRKTRICFRCLDCSLLKNVSYCKHCFQNSDHRGHRYYIVQQQTCSCGNQAHIKNSNFCSNHKGKSKFISQLPQNDQNANRFLLIFQHLFTWIFLLFQQEHPQIQRLAECVLRNLSELVDQGPYYQQLTAKSFLKKNYPKNVDNNEQVALIGQQKNSQKPQIQPQRILYSFLRLHQYKKVIKPIQIILKRIKQIPGVELQIVHLVIKAYNQIPNFQNSCCLQNQMTIMTTMMIKDFEIIRYLQNQRHFLFPIKKKFNEKIVLNFYLNLADLAKTKETQQIHCSYIKRLLENSKKYILPNLFINQINQRLVNPTISVVPAILDFQDTELMYFATYYQWIKVFYRHKQTKSINIFISKIFDSIIDFQLSRAQRNKVILPFHRILSMALFFLFQTNMKKVSFGKLIQALNEFPQQKVVETLNKIAMDILFCLWQYAQSFSKPTYIENYSRYSKDGARFLYSDILLLRMLALLINQANYIKKSKTNFSTSVQTLIDLKISEAREDHDLAVLFAQNISNFIALITQSVVSYKQDLQTISYLNNPYFLYQHSQRWGILSQSIYSISHQFKQEELEEFANICSFKQFMLKDALKYFKFDKKKKLFIRKVQINAEPFNLKYHPSLKKASEKFAKFLQIDTVIKPLNLQQEEQNVKKAIYTGNLIQKIVAISKQFIQKSPSSRIKFNEQLAKIASLFNQDSDQFKLVASHLYQGIRIDQSLFKGSFWQFFLNKAQVRNILTNNQRVSTTEDEEGRRRRQMGKKKIQELRNKRKIPLPQLIPQHEQQGSSEQICLICKESNRSKTLCVVARIIASERIQIITKSLVVSGCGHRIHFQCWLMNSEEQRQFFPCPLCNNPSNILLPIVSQYQKPNRRILQSLTVLVITGARTMSRVVNSHSTDNIERINQMLDFNTELIKSIFEIVIFEPSFRFEKFLNRDIQIYHLFLQGYRQIFFVQTQDQANRSRLNFKRNLIRRIQGMSQCKKYYKKQLQHIKYLASLLPQIFEKCVWQKNQEKARQQKQLIIKNFQQNNKQLTQDQLLISFNLLSILQGKPVNCHRTYQLIQIIKQGGYFLFEKNQIFSNFYYPPKRVEDLIKLRDEGITQSCKNSHQRVICLICQKKLCRDCGGSSSIFNHISEQHLSKGMYFNLLTGQVVYRFNQYIRTFESIYEDEFGNPWNPKKQPKDFKLEKYELQKHFDVLFWNKIDLAIRNSRIGI